MLITADQRNTLYYMMQEEDKESEYRAKIILLNGEGHTVPKIRRAANHHDINIRNYSTVSMKKVLTECIKNTPT